MGINGDTQGYTGINGDTCVPWDSWGYTGIHETHADAQSSWALVGLCAVRHGYPTSMAGKGP